jgi:hypothetical protein
MMAARRGVSKRLMETLRDGRRCFAIKGPSPAGRNSQRAPAQKAEQGKA